jgi:NhaA family Na+:H+ antiporter
MLGLGAVAGIGFTVSLFVAELAFHGAALHEAKVGILAASVLAAALGSLTLLGTTRRTMPTGR